MNEPTTVADALERLAALDALDHLIRDQRQGLRQYLSTEADRIGAQTGTAANFVVKGVGRAYVTQPGERIQVVDQDAWGHWARTHYPDRVLHRPRLHPTRFWSWLADHQIVEAEMREAGVLDDEVLCESGLEEEVAASAARRDDGTLVDHQTGEVLPLRSVAASAPTLTVRIDPKHRERLVARLRLPELAEAEA